MKEKCRSRMYISRVSFAINWDVKCLSHSVTRPIRWNWLKSTEQMVYVWAWCSRLLPGMTFSLMTRFASRDEISAIRYGMLSDWWKAGRTEWEQSIFRQMLTWLYSGLTRDWMPLLSKLPICLANIVWAKHWCWFINCSGTNSLHGCSRLWSRLTDSPLTDSFTRWR